MTRSPWATTIDIIARWLAKFYRVIQVSYYVVFNQSVTANRNASMERFGNFASHGAALLKSVK